MFFGEQNGVTFGTVFVVAWAGASVSDKPHRVGVCLPWRICHALEYLVLILSDFHPHARFLNMSRNLSPCFLYR